jgi:tetratricopeptide (TPR) repeat protein
LPEEALKPLARAVELHPDDLDGWIKLGVTSAQLGQLPEAIAAFKTALKLSPDSEQAHYNLAVLFLGSGEFDAAERHFRALIRLQPENPGAHNDLAILYDAAGRLHEAEGQFDYCVSEYPGYVTGWRNALDFAVTHERYEIGMRWVTLLTGRGADLTELAEWREKLAGHAPVNAESFDEPLQERMKT